MIGWDIACALYVMEFLLTMHKHTSVYFVLILVLFPPPAQTYHWFIALLCVHCSFLFCISF